MSKGKIGPDGEIIYDEPLERRKDRRLTLLGIVVGAAVTIIAAIIANNAGIINLKQIFNFGGSNGVVVVTATSDVTGATQTAIVLTQTAISQPTKVVQQVTNTPPSQPASTAIPTNIPVSAILYENDFEDGRNEGIKPDGGNWRVVTEQNGNKILQCNITTNGWWSVAHIGSPNWDNYAVKLRLRWTVPGRVAIGVRGSDFVDGYRLVLSKDNIALVQTYVDTNDGWQDSKSFYYTPSFPTLKWNDWNDIYILIRALC